MQLDQGWERKKRPFSPSQQTPPVNARHPFGSVVSMQDEDALEFSLRGLVGAWMADEPARSPEGPGPSREQSDSCTRLLQR
uniref:Uncharacterized protein n=1 Tax=Knipowitschia caucasica TaxID=637954 RepID=A0AAV2LFH1_KNICA